MSNNKEVDRQAQEIEFENREWLESLDYILQNEGPERVCQLLRLLQTRSHRHCADFTFAAPTRNVRVYENIIELLH